MDAGKIISPRVGWAGLLLSGIVASLPAQELGYIPGGYRQAMVRQAAHDCPCPPQGLPLAPEAGPPAVREEGTADEIPDPSSDAGIPPDDFAPEVADLSGDAAMASASQSAAPNMIGDTIGNGGTGYITIDGFLGSSIIPYAPGGGRKFKAATNQSPVPQQRFFYNFHWFEDALFVQGPGVDATESIDVTRHEFGWEWLLCGGMMSAQIQAPFSDSIESTLTGVDLDGGAGAPDVTDLEIGNIALALKCLLYQTECDALSLGLAIDLPTAHDVVVADVNGGAGTLTVENEAVTLSPFLGYTYSSPCRWFCQGFVQVAVPVNENDFLFTDINDVPNAGDIDEATLFYGDVGVGFWFYNSTYDGADCGGKGGCDKYGVAGVVELHYSASLDDDELVDLDDTAEGNTFTYSECDWLNLSLGLAAHHNCWTLTPAVVVPLRESPDRQFDVEFTVQVNRHY